MKSTGYVRKVDALGRIVIPKQLRRECDLDTNQEFEILIDGDSVAVRKYVPPCIFCDSTDNVQDFKGRMVCKDCLSELIGK